MYLDDVWERTRPNPTVKLVNAVPGGVPIVTRAIVSPD